MTSERPSLTALCLGLVVLIAFGCGGTGGDGPGDSAFRDVTFGPMSVAATSGGPAGRPSCRGSVDGNVFIEEDSGSVTSRFRVEADGFGTSFVIRILSSSSLSLCSAAPLVIFHRAPNVLSESAA